MHRFYCPEAGSDGESIELGPDETRHLRDVLRIKSGETIRVFDGLGREFECTVETVGKRSATALVINETEPSSPESPLDLTLAVGLIPGDKFDLAVQKAVELGVRRFIPMSTHRSEIKAKDARRRVERWQKIAFEAAKQCGRARLMSVDEPKEFDEIIRGETGHDGKILFSEEGTGSFSRIEPAGKMIVLIGPKGGWEPAERDAADNAGFSLVTLGGRIMRVETAVIAISAILQHRFGDMN